MNFIKRAWLATKAKKGRAASLKFSEANKPLLDSK